MGQGQARGAGCAALCVVLVCRARGSGHLPWAGARSPAAAGGPQQPRVPPLRTVRHRYVFKTCGPDGEWVTGPKGQSLRDATQCQIDAEDLEAQVGRAGRGL